MNIGKHRVQLRIQESSRSAGDDLEKQFFTIIGNDRELIILNIEKLIVHLLDLL